MIFQKLQSHHITATVLKMPWHTHIQHFTDITLVFSPPAFLDTSLMSNLQPFRATCNFPGSLIHPLPRETFLPCVSLLTLSHFSRNHFSWSMASSRMLSSEAAAYDYAILRAGTCLLILALAPGQLSDLGFHSFTWATVPSCSLPSLW